MWVYKRNSMPHLLIHKVIGLTEEDRESEFSKDFKWFRGDFTPNVVQQQLLDNTLAKFKKKKQSNPGHTDPAMVHIKNW